MFLRYLPRSLKKNQDPSSEIILKYGKGTFLTFIKDGWYDKLNKSFYLAYSLIQDPPQPFCRPFKAPHVLPKKKNEGPLFSLPPPPPRPSDLNRDWSLTL